MDEVVIDLLNAKWNTFIKFRYVLSSYLISKKLTVLDYSKDTPFCSLTIKRNEVQNIIYRKWFVALDYIKND